MQMRTTSLSRMRKQNEEKDVNGKRRKNGPWYGLLSMPKPNTLNKKTEQKSGRKFSSISAQGRKTSPLNKSLAKAQTL